MKLNQWMIANGIKNAELAKKLGRDPSIVHKLRKGQIRPSIEVLATLAAVTNGQVTVTDFVDPRTEEFAA